jgi:hypothetical protein
MMKALSLQFDALAACFKLPELNSKLNEINTRIRELEGQRRALSGKPKQSNFEITEMIKDLHALPRTLVKAPPEGKADMLRRFVKSIEFGPEYLNFQAFRNTDATGDF